MMLPLFSLPFPRRFSALYLLPIFFPPSQSFPSPFPRPLLHNISFSNVFLSRWNYQYTKKMIKEMLMNSQPADNTFTLSTQKMGLIHSKQIRPVLEHFCSQDGWYYCLSCHRSKFLLPMSRNKSKLIVELRKHLFLAQPESDWRAPPSASYPTNSKPTKTPLGAFQRFDKPRASNPDICEKKKTQKKIETSPKPRPKSKRKRKSSVLLADYDLVIAKGSDEDASL